MAKKILVSQFLEESNSFNPIIRQLSSFGGVSGDNMITANQSGITVKGVVDVLKGAGFDLYGGVDLRSGSAGPVSNECVQYFVEETKKHIKRVNPDGLMLVMHGATVSESSGDVCGDIISELRNFVGEDIVISVSFDLHANVTEQTVKNADYVTGYQTYPHLDLYETGVRAANRIVDHFNGVKTYLSYGTIPMIAPASGYTTSTGKLKLLMDKGHKYIADGVIKDFSVFQVQPWLDCPVLNSSVVVIAEDKATSLAISLELANLEYDLRDDLFGNKLIPIEEVIEYALNNKTGKPVVLADTADSPNAGANGDSAYTVEKLLPYKDVLRCAFVVNDPTAVDKAFSIGVGNFGDITVGASIAPKLSNPVLLKNVKVKSLHDCGFFMAGPQERGQFRYPGKTAVVLVGKINVLLCYHAASIGDRAFYYSYGVDPDFCDIVGIKACTSFRAGYEPIAAKIFNPATPGAANASLKDLPFEKRPTPLYPFEEIDKTITTKVYRNKD